MTIPNDLHLLKHPFYQAWMEGKLTQESLKDYAEQYFHHVKAFPRYLEEAIGLCDRNATAKTILEENLSEEDGTRYGTSHPELWTRFAEGMGATRASLENATLRSGIRNVVSSFMETSQASLPRALGALFAYESQVPEVATSKIEGLRKNYNVTDERTLAFFEVHRLADVAHRESIATIIDGFTPAEKIEAENAAHQACQSLWNFLTDVCHHNGIACA